MVSKKRNKRLTSRQRKDKTNSRNRYNRAIQRASHALDTLRHAAEDLLSQTGRINKRDGVEWLIVSIDEFKKTNSIKTREPGAMRADFLEVLANSKAWEPPLEDEINEMNKLIAKMRKRPRR